VDLRAQRLVGIGQEQDQLVGVVELEDLGRLGRADAVVRCR
jgi:hypothetical protein